MYLVDFLSICNEAMTVKVYTETKEIGEYNGRDSIPPEYNYHRVLNITATDKLKLGVWITEYSE